VFVEYKVQYFDVSAQLRIDLPCYILIMNEIKQLNVFGSQRFLLLVRLGRLLVELLLVKLGYLLLMGLAGMRWRQARLLQLLLQDQTIVSSHFLANLFSQ